ncbi:MAG: PorT family protein [Bacteroidia bacterium]|nr:PorT family protein [Bacteroidia bacterium]
MKPIELVKWILFIFIIFEFNITYAQNISYGGEIGCSFSAFSRNYNSFTNHLLGFTGGGYISAELTSFAGVSAEILYSQQGAASVDPSYIYYNTTSNLQRWSSDVRLHKIDVPILINIKAPGFDNDIYPVVLVGGAFGYTFKVTAKNYDITNLPNYLYIFEEGSQDVTDAFTTTDYAGVIGAGINFKGNFHYAIDFKYRVGLSNINRSIYNYINNKYSQNSFIITIKIGL